MTEESRRSIVDLSPLAKILPIEKIYDDLLARGVKEAGFLFEDLMKTVRKALPSVQLSAVDQENFRKIIERPYFKIAPEDRMLPPKQLVAKILEGVRYEPEGTPIWDMFEELLERGCDDKRISQAHPAFAGIIQQLSGDEALLLKHLHSKDIDLFVGYQRDENFVEANVEELGCNFPYLTFCDNALVYANHLEALGLVTPLIGLPFHAPVAEGSYEGYHQLRWRLRLSRFGKMFCKAVLSSGQHI